MIKNPNTNLSNLTQKNPMRASVPGSKGSLTIEAAFTIPLFLFAALCLIYLLEIHVIDFTVRSAAQEAGKQAAADMAILPVLNTYGLQQDLVEIIGSERLDRSIVEGGSQGIQCWTSYYNTVDEEIIANVNYTIKLPFPEFLEFEMKRKLTFRVKAWTGYARKNKEDTADEIVYVTENGVVYHTDYQCSYLQLSINFIPSSSLIDVRNENGGIYDACDACVYGEAMAGVYITEYGNKYHNSVTCSGLKRTIRAVKRLEVSGFGGCVKCAN